MIPRWQMTAIFMAVGALVVVAFYQTPRGKAWFSGECRGRDAPSVCQMAPTAGARP